jgi:hypothetical protein
MFPQTSNGQKPVDMFLANLKTVDMFLTAILRTGTKNDYEVKVFFKVSAEQFLGRVVRIA